MKFKVTKGTSMLKDYFGLLPGQSSTDFVKEKNTLSKDDLVEVTDLVAAEYASDEKKVKKFEIEAIV